MAADSDSWDADTFSVEEPVRKAAGGGGGGGDRWEGEDEDDDVKDNWDDDEEEKKETTEVKPETKVSEKKKIAEKIKEKERQQKRRQEEIKKRLEEPEEPKELTPEEQLADKLRLKKLQEESDLELAKETFGVTTTTVSGIDAMNPISRDDFTEFGRLLKDKITQYEKSFYYPGFLEALVRDICISLEIDDLKKVTNSLTVLCSEKQKQEKVRGWRGGAELLWPQAEGSKHLPARPAPRGHLCLLLTVRPLHLPRTAAEQSKEEEERRGARGRTEGDHEGRPGGLRRLRRRLRPRLRRLHVTSAPCPGVTSPCRPQPLSHVAPPPSLSVPPKAPFGAGWFHPLTLRRRGHADLARATPGFESGALGVTESPNAEALGRGRRPPASPVLRPSSTGAVPGGPAPEEGTRWSFRLPTRPPSCPLLPKASEEAVAPQFNEGQGCLPPPAWADRRGGRRSSPRQTCLANCTSYYSSVNCYVNNYDICSVL
uniref:Eukaryotic translation initiation factor 3 subunit J n=1 Tax=Ornithorhynchus anatinus TaxID=9258 RepID=A0A6I8NZQ2_ORNAN